MQMLTNASTCWFTEIQAHVDATGLSIAVFTARTASATIYHNSVNSSGG